MTGWPVERRVAPRRPGRCMASRIGLTDVSLGLDDDAARAGAAPVVDHNLTQGLASDVESGPIVENPGKLGRHEESVTPRAGSPAIEQRHVRPTGPPWDRGR